ncbi:DegV family protein [Fonticella tunisiensis]|uniref:DegV family protein with EDD domain n=1 Tax=Fonticella tunisiensis TaxID=1096341 RepID=A0A4R7KWL2_9CLOT|nr:DegV family protein [Fonticella tunisiensis]TDT63286.1 DegV family protein with EDD domain [Fonticella tunisiensis]
MSKIKFVTDSTAYIEKEFADKNHIEIVPLKVDFLGKIESEGFPGEFEEFFERLKESKDFPKTSQPAIGEFVKVFQEAVEDGYEVIGIFLSSKLSGTYSTACIAAEMVDPDRISVIDSETSVSNLKLLVERGMELADEGKSRKEIVEILNLEKKNMGINLTVDTLDYLRKGGRLSGAKAFIGSMLNMKPIIALIDGKLESIGRVRGKAKAVETMISNIPENVKHICICHIFSIDEAEGIKNRLEERFKGVPISIDVIGPVIGAHLGPKALGICFKW